MGKNRVSDVVENDKKLGFFALFRYATCTDILLNIASGMDFYWIINKKSRIAIFQKTSTSYAGYHVLYMVWSYDKILLKHFLVLVQVFLYQQHI